MQSNWKRNLYIGIIFFQFFYSKNNFTINTHNEHEKKQVMQQTYITIWREKYYLSTNKMSNKQKQEKTQNVKIF